MEYLLLTIIIIIFLVEILLYKKRKLSFFDIKKKGDDYERKVGKFFEKKGYKVIYNGLEKGLKDGGIDLICKDKNEILLIQCKNWEKWKVKHIHVKAFHSDSIKYIEENNLSNENVKLRYIIPNTQILHNSALQIFRNKYYNCRYMII